MTPEQTKEYVKCRKDPIYFIKNYGVIKHPTLPGGKSKFKMWDFQEDCVTDFLENSYNVILKARQLGISTVVAAYVAWYMMFFNNKSVFVLATKRDTAQNMITKVKVFFEEVPEWMMPTIVTDNKQSIELGNGSSVKAAASTIDAARSESLSLLVIDEAAFINKMNDIWTATGPTLATGGDCIALSSPNGMGNWFHKTYQGAEAGETMMVGGQNKSFNPIKLHWSLHPDRDDAWARSERKSLGDMSFAQEYDCDFVQSGNNVVSLKCLEWYSIHPTEQELPDDGYRPYLRDPEEKTWIDKNLWIWKYPDYSKKYILSADVARGDSTDYSAFHVIDVENYEQVAEYKGKLNTDTFAHLIHNTAVQYNNAYCVIENMAMGHHVVMKLIELEYKNLYWTVRDITKIHEGNYDQMHYDPYNIPKNAVPGFTTSARTRPSAVARLEEDLRLHEFILHSKRTINELETFIFDNGKPQAQDNYNDDLIMSLAIGMYVRATTLKIHGNDKDFTEALISGIGFENKTFDTIVKGGDDRHSEKYKMTLPNGEVEDFRWIF
jgi:hypothetical protein